jgi:threonine dehydrogenase-like Zn-dependent dehydrogenase
MRAVVVRNGRILVDDVADPVPAKGQVLVKSLACGICGSDLHTHQHLRDRSKSGENSTLSLKPDRDLILGHEFCCEVVDYGPNTHRKFRPGTNVCAIPNLVTADGAHTIGFSNQYPGAYGQYLLLTEDFLIEVPNGLDASLAALTEPLAVGLHAVEKADLQGHESALVLGCGPVGLAVIAALRLKGVRHIIASDYSTVRRQIALATGADTTIDPRTKTPFSTWSDQAGDQSYRMRGMIPDSPARPLVIFECVGAPGIIQQIIEGSPRQAKIVVVGLCMSTDHFEPAIAIRKELNLQFVIFYSNSNYASALRFIAEGDVDCRPWITGKVDLEGVEQAFQDLANPDMHMKIIVEP